MKLLIILAIFFISFSTAYPQSLKSISGNKNLVLTETDDNYVSFRLKPVYTSVQRSSGREYFEKGYGFTFTFQFDLGKRISSFLDFNYSSIKYFNNNKDHLDPPVYIQENKPSFMFIGGVKYYPVKSIIPVYIKGGLGILARENGGPFPPLLVLGLGCEYKLSKVINLFAESEADYYAGWISVNDATDLSIGAGISIYYEYFFDKHK
jgi:hypothetical protein